MGNITVCIFIIMLGVLLFMAIYLNKKQNPSDYIKIDKKINDEHNDILNACDTLYNVCEKHWKTEDEYYKRGLQKMPVGHKNVEKEWRLHEQEHMDTLSSIRTLKNNIINHINTMDKRDFHWV
jgi:predicted restriction endonuclease